MSAVPKIILPQTPAIRAYGAFSDAGPVRPLNEDAYLAVPERQLFGVADGLGGNGIGDVAAKKCLENVKYFVEHGLGDSEVTLPFIYRSYYTAGANLIFNAFLYANQQLFEENKKKQINSRGAASMMFVFFEGRHMTLANVGVCNAFLVRRGRVQSLVRPRWVYVLKGLRGVTIQSGLFHSWPWDRPATSNPRF